MQKDGSSVNREDRSNCEQSFSYTLDLSGASFFARVGSLWLSWMLAPLPIWCVPSGLRILICPWGRREIRDFRPIRHARALNLVMDGSVGYAFSAGLSAGIEWRDGILAACALETDIPASLREGTSESLGGELDSASDVLTLRNRGLGILSAALLTGHYLLSDAAFGDGPSPYWEGGQSWRPRFLSGPAWVNARIYPTAAWICPFLRVGRTARKAGEGRCRLQSACRIACMYRLNLLGRIAWEGLHRVVVLFVGLEFACFCGRNPHLSSSVCEALTLGDARDGRPSGAEKFIMKLDVNWGPCVGA